MEKKLITFYSNVTMGMSVNQDTGIFLSANHANVTDMLLLVTTKQEHVLILKQQILTQVAKVNSTISTK